MAKSKKRTKRDLESSMHEKMEYGMKKGKGKGSKKKGC